MQRYEKKTKKANKLQKIFISSLLFVTFVISTLQTTQTIKKDTKIFAYLKKFVILYYINEIHDKKNSAYFPKQALSNV